MSHDERACMTEYPEYGIWTSMIQRCENPSRHGYKNYGGRGIRVCERWRASYVEFICDVGPRPSEKHTIDRIDRDGHYEPGNVRWATRTEQNRNRKSVRLYTWRGETKCISEWALDVGISYFTLRGRLDRGWSIDDALTTPASAPSRRWA